MEDYLIHYGVLGMKWGVRRYQNKDGTLTSAGKSHYKSSGNKEKKQFLANNKVRKAVIIGSSVVGAALLTYGAYKLAGSAALKKYSELGKSFVEKDKLRLMLIADVGGIDTYKKIGLYDNFSGKKLAEERLSEKHNWTDFDKKRLYMFENEMKPLLKSPVNIVKTLASKDVKKTYEDIATEKIQNIFTGQQMNALKGKNLFKLWELPKIESDIEELLNKLRD